MGLNTPFTTQTANLLAQLVAGDIDAAAFASQWDALVDAWKPPAETLTAAVQSLIADVADFLARVRLIRIKGQVATVADLPGDAAAGDMYVVAEDGHFYALVADAWEDLGALGDLSDATSTATTAAAAAAASALEAAAAAASAIGREKLGANRTYYVRVDGDDSNTGLADTFGDAFLTLQKAVDVAGALDFAGRDVTIEAGDGTYTSGILIGATVGGGRLIIRGDVATPSNCVLSPASGHGLNATGLLTGDVYLQGFRIITSSGDAIRNNGFGNVFFSNIEFGASAGAHTHVIGSGARIGATGNYAIIAGASRHHFAEKAGYLDVSGRAITLTGTPAFSSAFALAGGLSDITVGGNTYTGAATGTRYIVDRNSLIDVGGAGSSYLPGNIAGASSNGGLYA